jgi:hypothetical protein
MDAEHGRRGRPKAPPGQFRTTRGIRLPETLWRLVEARAEERGETVTDVVERAVREAIR